MVNYWNGWKDGWMKNTATTSNTNYSDSWTSNDNCTCYHYVVRIRKYLVYNPDRWNDKDSDAFTRLINIDTHTGFIVEMVIKGDILITDPTIETRTMKDFLPLLFRHADEADHKRITAFFEKHTIEEEKDG